jgi:uncharacterized membrane protein
MDQTAKLRPDGFRERGGEVTRIEAFVDAAFAFALTMLVISVGTIPDTMPRLIVALKGTPAFAASFAQIAAFWYAHMSWSRRYGLDDSKSIVLSLLLVFLVMVFIYPLKIVYSTFFYWITGGWLPASFTITAVSDLRIMFILFGVVFVTMSIVISLLYLQAWRQRDALELTAEERARTVEKMAQGWLSAAVGTLSATLAALIPDQGHAWMMALPGTSYWLLSLSGVVPKWFGDRMRKRLQVEGPA